MARSSLVTETTNSAPAGSLLSSRIPSETLDHARDVGLSLLRSFADRPSYILGVTSALPSEGKTTISIALAEVMSTDFGLETVLLDVHAERPWSAAEGDFANHQGLSDWVSGECLLPDSLVNAHDRCSVLPIGVQSVTSRDLLQYMVKVEALQQLRERFSLIIVDLPELSNPAAGALANLCDGIVLVIRSGDTPADRVREFLPLLQNVTIHGAVLNRQRSSVPATLRRAFT